MKKKFPRFDKKLYKCHYNTVLKAVDTLFNDVEKSKLWLEHTNSLLGNVSPIQMLKLDRYQKLIDFIYTSLYENVR